MNYAVAGDPEAPALVLVPAQSESWWGYEEAMLALRARFRVYPVDLRGQGRSTWTPDRYTLDTMGSDLVRFLDLVVGRVALVAGNSSGGVLAAWLGAYAKPGQVRGVVLEDAAIFSSEVSPAFGQPIRQTLGPAYELRNRWLGDQWAIGDWQGLQKALARESPPWMEMTLTGMGLPAPDLTEAAQPPQNMKEYDPEWARAWNAQGSPSPTSRSRPCCTRCIARTRSSTSGPSWSGRTPCPTPPRPSSAAVSATRRGCCAPQTC